MSLTHTQWESLKQLVPAAYHKQALSLWNSAMKTVQQATRDQDAIARLHQAAANTAAKASQDTAQPICTSPMPDVSKSNLGAQIEILELLVLEMKRTGKPYANALVDSPSTLK